MPIPNIQSWTNYVNNDDNNFFNNWNHNDQNHRIDNNCRWVDFFCNLPNAGESEKDKHFMNNFIGEAGVKKCAGRGEIGIYLAIPKYCVRTSLQFLKNSLGCLSSERLAD